jgi:hypothetical protein
VSAKAESSGKHRARGWIPGPACGRPGMTLQVDYIESTTFMILESVRSKTIVVSFTVSLKQ